MKKREGLRSWMHVILMAVVVVGMSLLLVQVPVHAVDCPGTTADTDADGFTDQQECQGITFIGGGSILGKASQLSRAERLDPDTKDLFVILVPASPSNLPPNPAEYISKILTDGGLAITVHIITENQARGDRTVSLSSAQKAVRVAESLDISDPNVLGSSNSQHGTPAGLDLSTVYTERIKNHIMSVCNSACGPDVTNCTQCKDTTGVYGQAFIEKYIKHTIAHEIAHQLFLKTTSTKGVGYHYASNAGWILDYSVSYSGTTFNLGYKFTSADQSGAKLK